MTRRTMLAFSSAAAGLMVVAGTAIAGHVGSDVKSYTGCLSVTGGTLTQIKEGNAPLGECGKNQVEAHFSGGDITAIAAQTGGGLVGGGTNGAVSLSLRRDCDSGQVVKWNGTGWVCASDSNTTYAAGTGLDLTGSTFGIEPDYRVKNAPDCSSGQFATGFDSSGVIQCQAPASAGVEVWQKVRPAVTAGTVVELPKGEGVDVVMMPLPAGTFLVTAVADLGTEGGSVAGDDELSVTCFLRGGAFNALPVHSSSVDIGDGSVTPMGVATVHGVVSLANPDTVRFTCMSEGGDDDPDLARGATVTAVKVATVHTP